MAKAAVADAPDQVIETLESGLSDQLASMPTEKIWDVCQKMGIRYEHNGEPRRRADLIEDILTKEIEKAREDMERVAKAKRQQSAPRPVPTDNDIEEGTISLSLEELALIFAALLPPEAIVNPHMGRVEVYAKAAQRLAPDVVKFMRPDSAGNDRQYTLHIAPKWRLPILGE